MYKISKIYPNIGHQHILHVRAVKFSRRLHAENLISSFTFHYRQDPRHPRVLPSLYSDWDL